MVLFPIAIVLSITIYLYFKVAILRKSDPLEQRYANSKARVALGIFIITFGINQYAFYQTKLALYISIIFIALGILQLVYGFKTTSFYGKQLKERANEIND
ncbi:YtpI family protein [Pontibacillus litoralis]|uniref:YtpI-like protein n=1 Tax=Pontibacillus litoralis JSM 072002 TaxID=1385512 RepID=A0A0A5HZS4_9BACI|nr:YtpI family protein [Pontibacillus litoralis]KGX89107.1 hypothetical protein N784_01910 [Pontibacillus litoralis JSM 072002]